MMHHVKTSIYIICKNCSSIFQTGLMGWQTSASSIWVCGSVPSRAKTKNIDHGQLQLHAVHGEEWWIIRKRQRTSPTRFFKLMCHSFQPIELISAAPMCFDQAIDDPIMLLFVLFYSPAWLLLWMKCLIDLRECLVYLLASISVQICQSQTDRMFIIAIAIPISVAAASLLYLLKPLSKEEMREAGAFSDPETGNVFEAPEGNKPERDQKVSIDCRTINLMGGLQVPTRRWTP